MWVFDYCSFRCYRLHHRDPKLGRTSVDLHLVLWWVQISWSVQIPRSVQVQLYLSLIQIEEPMNTNIMINNHYLRIAMGSGPAGLCEQPVSYLSLLFYKSQMSTYCCRHWFSRCRLSVGRPASAGFGFTASPLLARMAPNTHASFSNHLAREPLG